MNVQEQIIHAPYPKDPRHQRFAERVLAGDTRADAYLAAGYKCTRASAETNAKRLLTRGDVQTYLKYLREKAAEQAHMSVAEKRTFLARIVRTPIAKLDPQDADHPDGDLIKSFSLNETESGSHLRVEMPDKLAAIKLDNELSNTDGPTNAIVDFAEALRTLKPND